MTGLQPNDFYVYNAFFDSVMDPMVALHNQQVGQIGYALAANLNNPHATDIYNDVLGLAIEFQSQNAGLNNYTALSMTGLSGYLILQHQGANESASFTPDYGQVANIPAYNESAFITQVLTCLNNSRSGKVLASAKLLQYCLDSSPSGVAGSLFDYFINQNMDLEYSQPKQLAYQYFTAVPSNQMALLNGFYASEDKYKRTLADTSNNNTNMVCTSCRANLTLILNSDFRIVKMEMNMNSSLTQSSTLAAFYGVI